jgi:hypothetical protein
VEKNTISHAEWPTPSQTGEIYGDRMTRRKVKRGSKEVVHGPTPSRTGNSTYTLIMTRNPLIGRRCMPHAIGPFDGARYLLIIIPWALGYGREHRLIEARQTSYITDTKHGRM